MSSHDTCSICLEPLIHHTNGVLEPLGAAMCGHCFHCECFWRWEEAKRREDWRRGVASRSCPCPVCNVPVREFIKLFIDGDTNEIKRLRKELKAVKCKLARDRVRLEQTRQELAAINERERTCIPRRASSSNLRDSSRRVLERDIEELVATAALLLGDPPPKVYNAKETQQRVSAQSSYRRHDSCPLSSTSFPETRIDEGGPPSIPVSISMPPAPRSDRHSRNRLPEEPLSQSRHEEHRSPRSSRRRPQDAPQPCSSSTRRSHSRTGPTSSRRAPTPVVTGWMGSMERPDPPAPVTEVIAHESASTSSLSGSTARAFEDPPSCRTLESDSVQEIAARNNAPTPALRRPLINFFGYGVDPPVQGLLGGCIYLD